MEIRIDSLVEGARMAEGLVVVIDVFRAFTTAAYIFANGAEKIIPVAGIDEALELRRQNPGYVLAGERKGFKPRGFDYGNSPYMIQDTDFSGKTAVMSTSVGIQGIVSAEKADEIVLGSFVCARAVADYILKKRPDKVTLVPLGNPGPKKADEDELCAAYIKELLQGKSPDKGHYLDMLRRSPDAQRFFDPSIEHSPEGDFYCASDMNRFDFVMKVQGQGRYLEIIRG